MSEWVSEWVTFSASSTAFGVVAISYFSYSYRYIVVLVYIFLITNDVTHFHVLIWPLYILFGEMSADIFGTFSNWDFFLSYCWILRVFKKKIILDTGAPGWLSQLSIRLLITDQVMISWFMSLSSMSGSELAVQSLLGILSLPLFLPLSYSVSQNK